MLTIHYLIINFLSYILPVKLACFITKWVVVIAYYIVYGEARKNVTENLIQVFGNSLPKWEKDKMVRETFLNFGLFIYEFLIIKRINKKNFKQFINPVGFENVEKALENGKGVIFLTGHLGNYEWGAAVLHYLGYNPIVIAKRYKNRFITNYYFNRRKGQGMDVVYLDQAVKESLRRLKKNGLVAIVGDRDYTDQGLDVLFFGKKTRFPTGALLLAIRTGATVIPTFALRSGMCKYDVVFNKPILLESKGYKQEDIEKDLMKWIKVLEDYIRKYPSEWYTFQPIWKTEKE